MSRKLRSYVVALLILAAVVAPLPASAATIEVQTGTLTLPNITLCTALGGNVDSTNTMDRGNMRGATLLKIDSVAGTTVTVNIVGSMDNTNFYNVAYATAAAPETVTVAALTITTTTTGYYILRPFMPWRYLKIVLSANTGMTITATASASIN
jgi:hypothetical protein